MDASLDTRASLLERLKRATGNEGWARFFNLYWKLVYNMARHRGLTDAEAQEVVQTTMITVARCIPQFQYKGERGSFKAWLMMHTRTRIVDEFRKRPSATPLSEEIDEPADYQFEQIWEGEWKQNLVTLAAERVKSEVTARAFQIYSFCVLQGNGPKRTAEHLKISKAAIYLNVHKINKLMAARTKQLTEELEKQ
jgi:RNA polymerase sigma-70 factor (ECF subfamily)